MKKRILFYYRLFFSGGTEHSILKLIRKISSDFEIIVAYDEEESTDEVLKEIAQYAQVINLNKIDTITVDTCIWCSYSKQVYFDKFALKVKATHYYYWGHILLFETYPNLEFYEDFRDNIEKFICVSETVKNDIVSKYPALEEKCIVLDNYLDVKEILKKSNEPVELKVNPERLNIVSVSRIAKAKGFGRMKQLCDILDEKDIQYDWYVIGNAFKQEVFDEIYNWFKENPKVHFLGYKQNVYPYVKQMDYLALLTDREACNLVITEALMLGVPSIVTNFEGVGKQITDGRNGIILEMTNNNHSYENRINDILLLKDKLKENIAQEDYNKEKVISTWIKLLNE